HLVQAPVAARVYPASSTAARTASSAIGPVLVTVTTDAAPGRSSTATRSTPSSSVSSSVTLATQCEQVMPSTMYSALEASAAVVDRPVDSEAPAESWGAAQQLQAAFASVSPRSVR